MKEGETVSGEEAVNWSVMANCSSLCLNSKNDMVWCNFADNDAVS